MISIMKKTILLLPMFTLFFGFSLNGQHHNHSNRIDSDTELVQSLKIAFLTSELSLTPSESEKFWPVYNEYKAKSDRSKRYSDLKQGISIASTDAEANTLLSKIYALDQERADLRKEYYQKMTQILGPLKVIKLHSAEYEFKKEMLHKMKNQYKNEG